MTEIWAYFEETDTRDGFFDKIYGHKKTPGQNENFDRPITSIDGPIYRLKLK